MAIRDGVVITILVRGDYLCYLEQQGCIDRRDHEIPPGNCSRPFGLGEFMCKFS